MKFSRPATVFAAVALLAGGTAVAVNAATETTPVKLCSNTKNAAVTLPGSNGTCPRGTSTFFVASDDDVRALAGRLTAAETMVAQLAARVTALEPGRLVLTGEPHVDNTWMVSFTGSKLQPGSEVHLTADGGLSHIWYANNDGTTVPATILIYCSDTNVQVTGTGANGDPVTSNVIAKGPGCP